MYTDDRETDSAREWEGGAKITHFYTYVHDWTLGILKFFSVFSFVHGFDSVTNLIVGFIAVVE